MKFNGDIIITDPCYVVKDDNDWDLCNYGENLEELNIRTFLSSDGGDCVGNGIVDSETGELLGEFCSDSNMVSVMDLSDLMAYHPHCLDDLETHCYTIIRGFVGEVERIEIEDDEDQYWAFVGTGNISFRTDSVE